MKKKSPHVTTLATRLVVCLSIVIGATIAGWAQDFTATLRGAYEVPPISGSNTGSAQFTLSNNVLTSLVYFPPAPEGDLHSALCCTWPSVGIWGPAPAGANGSLILELTTFYPEGDIVICFSTDQLSDGQLEQLKAGLLYINILFQIYPELDMRGQICPLTAAGDCDNDSVPNGQDACPATPPGTPADATGCSIAESVSCDGPWKDHKEYVRVFREIAMRFWKEGKLTIAERNELIKQAEESSCGEPSI